MLKNLPWVKGLKAFFKVGQTLRSKSDSKKSIHIKVLFSVFRNNVQLKSFAKVDQSEGIIICTNT